MVYDHIYTITIYLYINDIVKYIVIYLYICINMHTYICIHELLYNITLLITLNVIVFMLDYLLFIIYIYIYM